MEKARSFWEAADILDTMAEGEGDAADPYVALCVLVGIAAADVLCCARLGRHAKGQDHAAAVALLATIDAVASKHLNMLLGMKSQAGYGVQLSTRADCRRAKRAASALLKAAAAASR